MPHDGSPLPLTATQSGLWFAQRLDPSNPVFQLGAYSDIRGPMQPHVLERAVHQMSMEAEVLRARFIDTVDGPAQVICAEPQWTSTYADVSGEADPVGAALAAMAAELGRPVEAGHPLGANQLFRVGENHHLLYRRAHHVLVDGYGSIATANRTAAIYSALVAGQDIGRPFPPLRALLDEDAAYQGSEAMRADREFWLSYMSGHPEAVSLVGDRGSLVRQPRQHSSVLGSATVTGLENAAARAGVSWPRLAIAIVAAYLHRMTGANEVTLALPVTGRMTPLAKVIPGVMSNVIPVRCAVTPDLTLAECAAAVTRELDRVMPHQRFPVDRLRRELGLGPTHRLYGPRINVMPFYEHLNFAGIEALTQSLARGPFEDMAIALTRHRGSNTIRMDIDADPALYSAQSLSAHHARFAGLLAAVEHNLDVRLGDLPLVEPTATRSLQVDPTRINELSDEEVDRLLRELEAEEARDSV